MKSKSILFVSTVREWGGSEVLWARTAEALVDRGYHVQFAVRYKTPVVEQLKRSGASYIDISNVDFPPLHTRILRKLKLLPHPFSKTLSRGKPQLVVINLSNNIQGENYLTTCMQQGFPYVTLVNLVPIALWSFMNDEGIGKLREAFARSHVNYFASQANVEQHNIMLGDDHSNSKVILNPITVPADIPQEYPPIIDGQYKIALVGRLESYHKGQDLLLQVLRQRKWKERPITFSIYGIGPHTNLLQRLVKKFEITNVIFEGYVQDVADIWKTNHLLLMPSRLEGQSLALIEALWCYRGAVVTDVGGAKELIEEGENGFIAPNAAVSDIDNALERAWTARYKWEKIGKNAGRIIRDIYKYNPVTSFTEEIQRVFSQVSAR